MSRSLAAALVVALSSAAILSSTPAHTAPLPPLTLERIMADPDWIGPGVESPFWSLDGRAVLYRLKQKGSPVRDLHRISLADGRDAVVSGAALANVDAAGAQFDRARHRAVFVRNGDVFVRELASGHLRQITRTAATESAARFSGDDRAVQYRANDVWWSVDLASGRVTQCADVTATKDPDERHPNDLERLQLRLIATLRRDRADRDSVRASAEAQRLADSTRAQAAFHLGEDVKIEQTELSPSGEWMLVVTTPKSYDGGRAGRMPRYVTESGYEESDEQRTRVGRNDPAPETLWKLDLVRHRVQRLAYASLPGIHDDPLAAIRAENDSLRRARGESEPAADSSGHGGRGRDRDRDREAGRPCEISSIVFSRDGARAAVRITAHDHKDRWIASIAAADTALVSEHRLHDDAWINWSFNECGWLTDDTTLWYLSEENGHSQLWTKPRGASARTLTPATCEVSEPALTPDGRTFVMIANAQAPYAYDVYRVPAAGGAFTRVTQLNGAEHFALSPDGARLLVTHSSSHVPAQLSLVPLAGGAARTLTDTRTVEYRAIPWPEPAIVAVPSTHGAGAIWSKFYDVLDARGQQKHPIVLFVHGAGYTQNTHLHWPGYYREQMFHHLLTQRGFLVLDMDYRASQGYGRDWRTAIYRHMGGPELEDLIEGVQWLVREHDGDPARVGVYGGSYGGFMTLMAMFRAGDVFKAGAALRPVTDWTQYNHLYTSDILNTPQIDPEAYRRSSPIEFADGLKGPLLICHGMVDDNVFFEDSVRLWQRLLELHKDDIELAPYPLERHGFTHADSWLDEYKRIDRLFESRLGTPR